jgi:hypothetical protein
MLLHCGHLASWKASKPDKDVIATQLNVDDRVFIWAILVAIFPIIIGEPQMPKNINLHTGTRYSVPGSIKALSEQ